jgi:hypothetical protein
MPLIFIVERNLNYESTVLPCAPMDNTSSDGTQNPAKRDIRHAAIPANKAKHQQ